MMCATCGSVMNESGSCTNNQCNSHNSKFAPPGVTFELGDEVFDPTTQKRKPMTPEWRTASALERIASVLEKMQPIVEKLAMAWAKRPILPMDDDPCTEPLGNS